MIKHETDVTEAGDIIISTPEQARGMFFPYKHKETGEVITLYYKDKKFEQKNARSALGTITEEFPDLTIEEAVLQQKDLLAQIEAEVRASREKGRRGGRSTRGRGREGRGRTLKSSQVITINTSPAQSRNMIDPAFLDVLSREGYVPVQGLEEEEEVQKAEEVITRRKKKSTADIAQVDTAVPVTNSEADTNSEDNTNPDEMLIADYDTDEKVVKILNLIILAAVVDSHYSEVDE